MSGTNNVWTCLRRALETYSTKKLDKLEVEIREELERVITQEELLNSQNMGRHGSTLRIKTPPGSTESGKPEIDGNILVA